MREDSISRIDFETQISLEKEKECKPPGIIGTLKELKE
jgi:hypothetical protein